jgi:inorganic pyrophosphatase
MSNISNILNFHISSFDLSNAAKKIIPVTLSNQNDLKIDKLNKLTERLKFNKFHVFETFFILKPVELSSKNRKKYSKLIKAY